MPTCLTRIIPISTLCLISGTTSMPISCSPPYNQKHSPWKPTIYSKTLKLKDINGALNTLIKCDELISQIRQIRFNETDKLKLGAIASQIYENGIGIATYLSERTFKKDYYQNLAFNFCERSKSSILLSAINDTNAKQFAGIPDSELVVEDSLKNEIGFLEQQLAQLTKEEEIQQVKIELLKYQNALRDFISRLETRYPEYYNLKYNTELAGIPQIQSTLDENTRTALLFCRYRPHLHFPGHKRQGKAA